MDASEFQILVLNYSLKPQSALCRVINAAEGFGMDPSLAWELPEAQALRQELRILKTLFDSYDGGIVPLDPSAFDLP